MYITLYHIIFVGIYVFSSEGYFSIDHIKADDGLIQFYTAFHSHAMYVAFYDFYAQLH